MSQKGQWFLISAVIASGAFLALSFFFKDYFVLEASFPARNSHDAYLYSLAQQLDNIVGTAVTNDPPRCINLTTRLDELKVLAERALAPKGLFVFLNYTVLDCAASNIVAFDLLVASHDEVIYNFTTLKNYSQVIG